MPIREAKQLEAIRDLTLQKDAIALKYMSYYFGIPRYGHERCYKRTGSMTVAVTQSEPHLLEKVCSGCGKPLAERL